MSRPAHVIINQSAIRHNLNKVRQMAPDSQIMAIVKADAYGHGVEHVTPAMQEVNAFGVACLEEASALRSLGISKPIVLLEGHFSKDEFAAISQLHLDLVIHHQSQIDMLQAVALKTPLNVWIKIDTGMHRLGFDPAEVPQVIRFMQGSANVSDNIRLMSHFATANEKDMSFVRKQTDSFYTIAEQYKLERSFCNSAAVINDSQSHMDWIRPGLMMYGISPFAESTGKNHGLIPAMSLKSKLISVKRLQAGETVGYGATWTCPETMPIGIVAAGYGDGYPRHAPSGTPILVNDKVCQLIGRASMDMLAVDLRHADNAAVGDEVLLWGENLPVEEIARAANTIPYQLVCAMHKRLRYEIRA